MIRIGIRRQIPLCSLLLVVVVVACLRSACLGRSHISSKMAATFPDRNGPRPTNADRIGKLAVLSRGRFFFDAEFQVWRGRIPEKSSKSGHFPLGVDCLYARVRCSEILTTGPPITSSVLSQASHRIQ